MRRRNLSTTVFLAVHGGFSPHPWLANERPHDDAYGLFHSHSEWMGRVDTSGQLPFGPGTALWGMNDAGDDFRADQAEHQIAWWQVQLITPPDNVLPVLPLLDSAFWALRQVGDLDPTEVQIMLPIQHTTGERGSGGYLATLRSSLLSTSPGPPVPVWVILDTGVDDHVHLAEPIAAQTRRPGLNLAELVTVEPGSSAAAPLEPQRPALAGDYWYGGGHHRMSFTGQVSAWSEFGISFLLLRIASACHELGIRAPVEITVRRRAAS